MPQPTLDQVLTAGFDHHRAGRLVEAEALYRRILATQPDHAEALHHLGVLAHQVARHDLAVDLIRRAVALAPANPSAHSNLGAALVAQGCLEEAVAAYQNALQLKPDDAAVHSNLGIALAEQGLIDEATAAHRRALELKPDFAGAHMNLGYALKEHGCLDEAVTAFREALRIEPQQPAMWSNLVYTLLFHPACTRAAIAAELRNWNRQLAGPLKAAIRPHSNHRDPERRLRIGYVSPEFRDHVTGRYLIPLFKNHDQRNFEILCYAGVMYPDHTTEDFRRGVSRWRNTLGVTDRALAEMIREDGVDILVDLTQHLAGNRLPMFAHQPAPIQLSFAGYPESAGLEAIPTRISDCYLESETGPLAPGEQVHLIESFWCYDPCGVEVEVNESPAKERGWVTFGCLNNFCKINDSTLRLWSQVLGKVNESRLVLLAHPGSHRQRTTDFFLSQGIAGDRVEFVAPRQRKAYLELHHGLDIVLDPFPYGGHTTSMDALWMGVPVVSLAGECAVSRAGLSQLSNLDLQELVAFSEDDYVRFATKLAGNLPRLEELRATLRSRLEASPLMDAPRFARSIEAVYRSAWKKWCAQRQPS